MVMPIRTKTNSIGTLRIQPRISSASKGYEHKSNIQHMLYSIAYETRGTTHQFHIKIMLENIARKW